MIFRSVFAILYFSCNTQGFLDGLSPPAMDCLVVEGTSYENYAKVFNETVLACAKKDGCVVSFDKAAKACNEFVGNGAESFYTFEGRLSCEGVTSGTGTDAICVPSDCTADKTKEQQVNFINYVLDMMKKAADSIGGFADGIIGDSLGEMDMDMDMDMVIDLPFKIPDGAKNCTFEAGDMKVYSTSAQFSPGYVSSIIVLVAGITGVFV
eukprot:CAMPEP_0172478574 /NCGR_PEP_ID=MMETSP1066-20121228/2593_1 /TAXON_ID=671091 /ORGANISM="Coscinodiscus wailesii, Strain CCMP2513" /LENGTH=208 /DNA_ID=CAMNT_0013238261 /DNA_START=102 /DNA_END=728 /DNA_ORIENTATION=-